MVHIGGLPADLAGIQASVQEAARGLGIAAPPLVEDAAHAFPSPMPSLDGRFAGTVGRAGAFAEEPVDHERQLTLDEADDVTELLEPGASARRLVGRRRKAALRDLAPRSPC